MREAESKIISLDRLKIILAGFGFILLFWILESLIHVFVFNERTVYGQIFYPDTHEFWMRSLLVGMIFLFSLFAQYMVNIHRKSEERIKQSHGELDQIFNTAADGMRVIDKNFNVLRVNKTFSNMANVTMEEAIGKKCYEVFSGPLCHTPDCPLKQIMSNEERVEYEVEKVRRDGSVIPCIVYATPFRNPEGELVGIVEDFRDITDRKQVENFLKESERKYRSLIEKAPVGIIFIDQQGQIIDINPELLEILGSPSIDSTKSINVLTFSHLVEMGISEDVKFCLHNEETIVSEKPYTSRWGKSSYLRYHLTPVYDTKGGLQGVQGIVEDISDRKSFEESLRESEGKLNAMLQSIGDHMSMMDKDLNIIWANYVAKQNFGEDIIGKKCYEVYHRRDKPCEPYPCLTLKAFEDGEIHEHETSVINKNGEERYFHCTANTALRDDDGNPVGVIEVSRDVTDQKLTEMSLEKEMKINAAVANLSSALLSPTSIEEMSNLVLEHAKHLTHSNVGYVGYIEPHTGYMTSPTMKGEVWDSCQVENKDTVFKKFGGLWDWVLNNKESILTNTPLEDPLSTGLPDGHTSIDQFLAVPATIDGELVGIISVANSEGDYTERDLALVERLADLFAIAIKRKQTEDELQEERNKLEAIIGAINDGLSIQDREFNILYQNEAEKKIVGDCEGQKCYQAIYGRDKVCENCQLKLAFEDGQPHTRETEFINNSGGHIYLKNTASPIKDTNGEVISCLEIVRDITEQKKAEKQIKKSLEEKEALLKEIHHRVKNNLQVISSLINLQSRYIRDDKILEVLRESQNRIKSMALVHEKMYQSEDLNQFDFTEYLRTLVSHLVHSYGCAGKVNLNMDIGDIYLNLDTAIPCSLIINELVSNSLKHAFPDGLNGEIVIKFHKAEGDGFKLVVSDNGKGFPEEIDYLNTDSLGLQLVKSLTRQLNGDISLYNEVGTTFEIIFPATSKQTVREEVI